MIFNVFQRVRRKNGVFLAKSGYLNELGEQRVRRTTTVAPQAKKNDLPTKVGSRWNQMHSSLMVDIYTQLSHARHWYFMQGSQRSCIWYSSSLVKERATVESFWLMPMSNCSLYEEPDQRFTDSIVVMIIIEEELEEVWWVDLVQRLQSWQKHDGKLLTFQKNHQYRFRKKIT